MFLTGINEWRRFDVWPPKGATPMNLYFQAKGKLTTDTPGDSQNVFDEYLSDPSRPVPFVGYIVEGMTGDYMTEDQRFAAERPDVLVYQTAVLEDDLTIAGPVKVNLNVSTSGTDADFVVTVIDVYPNDYPSPQLPQGHPPAPNVVKMGGYQQLVHGEPFRAKFRNSFEKPEAMTPNQPAAIKFAMPDVYHTFRKGHKVMIQVQSSWFPLVDRNPQKFIDIPKAKPEDFQKATQRLYRSRSLNSSVTLLVEGRPLQVTETR
jgi:putative CocE/NonD family hydrolase